MVEPTHDASQIRGQLRWVKEREGESKEKIKASFWQPTKTAMALQLDPSPNTSFENPKGCKKDRKATFVYPQVRECKKIDHGRPWYRGYGMIKFYTQVYLELSLLGGLPHKANELHLPC